MTYSIVARDPVTGALGVGVQSCAMGVGRAVPWVRAGVGAVATQSFTNRGYGPRGLGLMAAGRPPEEALAELVAADEGASVRQVAFVDAVGRVAAHTGGDCVPHASHITGDGVSAQGNMLASAEVVPAMVEAFSASGGPLPERLLATLDAADAAGGDMRGRQAAALLVADGPADEMPWDRVKVDLRVDDHPEPLRELRRLLELQRTYERYREGDARAVAELAEVGPVGMRGVYAAMAAAGDGDLDGAREALQPLRAYPGWAAYLRLAAEEGHLPRELLD